MFVGKIFGSTKRKTQVKFQDCRSWWKVFVKEMLKEIIRGFEDLVSNEPFAFQPEPSMSHGNSHNHDILAPLYTSQNQQDCSLRVYQEKTSTFCSTSTSGSILSDRCSREWYNIKYTNFGACILPFSRVSGNSLLGSPHTHIVRNRLHPTSCPPRTPFHADTFPLQVLPQNPLPNPIVPFWMAFSTFLCKRLMYYIFTRSIKTFLWNLGYMYAH